MTGMTGKARMAKIQEKPENVLTQEEVEFFKKNKHLITQELLDALRSQGKLGRHQAIEILDLEKNEKQFYLDAFGDPISFNGDKSLKKLGTQLALTPIHVSEIERCAKDFNYFRENYIQIKTKSGVDFPDLREYQDRFIEEILKENKEEIVGLMGRQCIDGETALDLNCGLMSISKLWDYVDTLETF